MSRPAPSASSQPVGGRRLAALGAVLALVAACAGSIAPTVSPEGLSTAGAATPGASPPAPTPVAPAASRDPSLRENQSAGTVTIHLSGPVDASGDLPAVCSYAWDEPLRVLAVDGAPALAAGSERLGALIHPEALGTAPSVEQPSAFELTRSGAYEPGTRASFGAQAGGTMTAEASRPFREGRVTFTELPTTADTFPVDLLPGVARAAFGGPLDGNPAAATITGVAAWSCDPPDPSWELEPPRPTEEPSEPSALPPFGCALSSADGGGVQRGRPLCGFTSTICNSDGGCTTGVDSCGTGWVAPIDYPAPLEVAAGDRVAVGGLHGWVVEDATARAVTVEEVEATLGAGEGVQLAVVRDAAEDVTFAAPASSGTWLVLVEVRATAADRGSSGEVSGRVLFRVDVRG